VKQYSLAWLDLEMTGLDSQKNHILEIAVIVTDNDLNIMVEGPAIAINQLPEVLENMDPWSAAFHQESGLLDAVRDSSVMLHEAEERVLNFLKEHCDPDRTLLCGNSVWQDKAFLKKWMPNLANFLYYRIIDVTTVKELVRRWYSENPAAFYEKQEVHRSLDDIRESINELKHYRKHFFVK